jgi:type I restriction enzyme S subunit
MAKWRASTWGEEISLEYGKALRGYGGATGQVPVYGTNGPVGWTDQPLAPGPGVILGRKGAYRGVHFSPQPFFVIDTAYYVAPKTELDMRWLYYAMVHHKLGEIDDGSPIPSTTRSAVYHCELEVPDVNEQRAIAAVLGSLDDKIDLNWRMNETLEAMARAIFKSWFVDFDPVRAKAEDRDTGLAPDLAKLFPKRFGTDGLPEGWQTKKIQELPVRIAMGPFGSRIKTENFVGSGVPVIRGGNLRDGFVDEDFVFVTPEKAQELGSAAAFSGDIVITHRGTLGQVGKIPSDSNYNKYIVSQSQMLLGSGGSYVSLHFLYEFFRSPAGLAALLANTTTTGVPAIARPTTSLRAIELIYPSNSVLKEFDRIVHELEARRVAAKVENETLAALRNLLLPKLMSGEIRIKDVKKLIGDVGA